MSDRFEFLLAYLGSAAFVAFLAVCLQQPEVATFTCSLSAGTGAQRCELSAVRPAVESGSGEAGTGHLSSVDRRADRAAIAVSN